MRSTAVRLKWKPLTILCFVSIILLIIALEIYSSVEVDDNLSLPQQDHVLEEQMIEDITDKKQLVRNAQLVEKVKTDEYTLWDEPQGTSEPSSPGENGVGVQFTPEENVKVEKSYSLYGFNQYVSDQISLHRSLSDPRPKQ